MLVNEIDSITRQLEEAKHVIIKSLYEARQGKSLHKANIAFI